MELDGNVHLIGTQGVGKSTLLRAILFFYNAHKTKLGIPREKKGFDEYYFSYQNSYIIYEIVKNDIPFCVLAYKINGKVAYRFFNSAYKKELFIDENNRAFESWEKIRMAFGKNIYYTPIVASYEDFRRIIYGDNKGLKSEFRKYALIESKQYQNIPRTIQNVFLNSNLEAQFIKDTIIKSLNEEEYAIDLENYAKNHLRDFESQLNDIKIWSKKNKKGQIVVRKQADKIIDKYRVFNYLKREKKSLARQLAARMNFIEREKPAVLSNFKREQIALDQLFQEIRNLEDLHKKREQKLVSDIDHIKKELKKAREKQKDYEVRGIEAVIKKVAEKEGLIFEKVGLTNERNLLNSKFAEISQKFEALMAQERNRQQELLNAKNAEINKTVGEFADRKNDLLETYEKLIKQVIENGQEQKEAAKNALNEILEEENRIKRQKAELKHQRFFGTEIEATEKEKTAIEKEIYNTENNTKATKSEINTLRKEWTLEEKDLERDIALKIEKAKEKQQKLSEQIQHIEKNINQSKSSFYGWLNDNVPNWQNNIGKIADEDEVLFNTELNPSLSDAENATFYGVKLNLNALRRRVKSEKEYRQEIAILKNNAGEARKSIAKLENEKENDRQKLKRKFRKKLKGLEESIAENEYKLSQSEGRLDKIKLNLDDWLEESKSEKKNQVEKLENELEAVTSKKLKAATHLDELKKSLGRKISLKETERKKEVGALENEKQLRIAELEKSIAKNKQKSERRMEELKKQQISALEDKGADTQRLQEIEKELDQLESSLTFIGQNETLVIEYKKDKRELLDKVPEMRAEKTGLEKKRANIAAVHKTELDKNNEKLRKQKLFVNSLEGELKKYDGDLESFEKFQKSDAFRDVRAEFSETLEEKETSKLATALVSAINENHYKSIETFKQLQQAINAFIGNFGESNIFRFKVKLNTDEDFLGFARDLKEFIEEDKINEFENRVNARFAHIIQLIGRETNDLVSKEAEIEKIIKKINDDFVAKNFVEAIKHMEMRTQKSSNPVVRLLINIKEYNDENSLILGETNLFTTSQSGSKNQKAVDLLKQLIKELERYKSSTLSLSESFDLQFRIVENDNDSGWVEKLAHVGSEGTDVLVKAMINILLLNVFKETASKKFKEFKLHCMMDEIGRLHPNNVRGILRFANERNIMLINGSPTSQSATDYKYTYKLAKQQSKSDSKKYITKINRLVKVNAKVLNG